MRDEADGRTPGDDPTPGDALPEGTEDAAVGGPEQSADDSSAREQSAFERTVREMLARDRTAKTDEKAARAEEKASKAEAKADEKAAKAEARAEAKAAKVQAKAAEEQRARPVPSLSARSRAEGWDEPEGDLAKYRSHWRSAVRFVLQRVIFKAVVHSAVTPKSVVARRVRTVRGPYVLVANHTSHVDAPMIALSLPWSQAKFLSTGVAADYFFNVWYRRFFVRWMFNAFPIDRGGSRKHSGTSRNLLRSGVPILVFPEGGRQKDGRMKDFKPGGAALAISVGVPVIPAAIVGGYEAMPKGRNWPAPGRPPVTVVFGDPMIADEGETAVEFSTRIHERVKDLYDDHYEEVLGGAAQGEEGPA